MDKRLQELLLGLIKLRGRSLLIILLASLPLSIVVSRRLPVRYTAEMRIFVDAPRLTDSETLSPGEGLEQTGRDKVINTQKGLIDSYSVYKYAKEKLLAEREGGPKPTTSMLRRVKSGIKDLILGRNFSVELDDISDPNYQKFKEVIEFKPEVQSGYFLLGFSSRDPEQAVKVTQYLYEGLLELQKDMQNGQRDRVAKYIDKKLQEARENLAQVEEEIGRFVRENGPPPNADYTSSSYKNLASVQLAVSNAELDMKEKQMRMEHSKSLLEKLTRGSNGEAGEAAADTTSVLVEIDQLESALLGRTASGNRALTEDVRKRLNYLYDVLRKRTGSKRSLSVDGIKRTIDETIRRTLQAESDFKIAEEIFRNRKAETDKMQEALQDVPLAEGEYNKLLLKQVHFTKLIDTMTKHYVSMLAKADSDFVRLHAISKPLIDEGAAVKTKYRTFMTLWLSLVAIFVIGLVGFDFSRQIVVLPWQITDFPAMGYLGIFPRPLMTKKKAVTALDQLETNPVAGAFARQMKRVLPKPAQGGQSLILAGQCPSADRVIFGLALAGELAKAGASVLLVNTSRDNIEAVRRFYPKSKRRYRTNKSMKDLLDYLTDEGKRGVAAASVVFIPMHEGNTMKKQFKAARAYFDYVMVDTGNMSTKSLLSLVSEDDSVLLTCCHGSTSLLNINRVVSSIASLGIRSLQVRTVLISRELPESKFSGTNAIAVAANSPAPRVASASTAPPGLPRK